MEHELAAHLDKEIVGMLHAVVGMEGESRRLVFEQLLDRLTSPADGVGFVVSKVLQGSEDETVRSLGRAMLERIEHEGLRQVTVPMNRHELDVLVLTPKEAEFRACLDAFGVRRGVAPLAFGLGCDVWRVEHEGIAFGIAVIGGDGNVEAAIEIGKLLAYVDFRSAVLVGMAAGLEGKVRLGDVVVASSVLAYEFERRTPTGPAFRPKAYSPASRVVQRVAALGQRDPEWPARVCMGVRASSSFGGIDDEEPEKLSEEWRPRVSTGVILAGSRLIEDDSLPELRREMHDRVVAAEMEGAGFAAACQNENIPWLVVRGVADYGQEGRGKSWQFPAAFAAASLVRDGIPSGILPLVGAAEKAPSPPETG